tara:strand:+ start:172 stop:1719 length:1548 start_codon:yes stop_codon:yes gene_type:complete
MNLFEKLKNNKRLTEKSVMGKNFSVYLREKREKRSDAYKQYLKSKKGFEKGFKGSIKPTIVQPGLDLYKAGGPFIPDKTTYVSGKKTPRMEPKPQFGPSKTTTTTRKVEPRTALKQAVADIRASDKRLYDAGVKSKTTFSRPQQKKIELDIIKGNEARQNRINRNTIGQPEGGSFPETQASRQAQRRYVNRKAGPPSSRGPYYDPMFGDSDYVERPGGGTRSSKPKPKSSTITVKQSEISKKASDYTDQINKTRLDKKAKVTSSTNRPVTTQGKTFKQISKDFDPYVKDLETKRETLRSKRGKKDVDKIRQVNRDAKTARKLKKLYAQQPGSVKGTGAIIKRTPSVKRVLSGVSKSDRITMPKVNTQKNPYVSKTPPKPTGKFKNLMNRVRANKFVRGAARKVKNIKPVRGGLYALGAYLAYDALRPKKKKFDNKALDVTKSDYQVKPSQTPSLTGNNPSKYAIRSRTTGKPIRYALGSGPKKDDLKNTYVQGEKQLQAKIAKNFKDAKSKAGFS